MAATAGDRVRAAAGTIVFLAVAPGVVTGLVPWWLTSWETGDRFDSWVALRVVGWVLVVAGVAVLLRSFARFVVEGIGTPAPVAPTDRLVIGGLYRYVRNPMYLAVIAIIVGQALGLAQPALLLYAAAVFAAVASFVRFYEEPTLRARYGPDYDTYVHAVPGWWPRRPAGDRTWHRWCPKRAHLGGSFGGLPPKPRGAAAGWSDGMPMTSDGVRQAPRRPG